MQGNFDFYTILGFGINLITNLVFCFLFSGSCRAAKTTWYTFGICKVKRLYNACKATQMLSYVQHAIPQKISLPQPHLKMTKQSNCGRVTRKRQKWMSKRKREEKTKQNSHSQALRQQTETAQEIFFSQLQRVGQN